MGDERHMCERESLDGFVGKERFSGDVTKNGTTDGKKKTDDEHYTTGKKRERSW